MCFYVGIWEEGSVIVVGMSGVVVVILSEVPGALHLVHDTLFQDGQRHHTTKHTQTHHRREVGVPGVLVDHLEHLPEAREQLVLCRCLGVWVYGRRVMGEGRHDLHDATESAHHIEAFARTTSCTIITSRQWRTWK